MTDLATDARREAALERYGLPAHGPRNDLKAMAELASAICDVPRAAVNLITTHEQHQVATVGFEAAICAREDSMCAVVLEDLEPVMVPDARLDSRFAGNPFVTGEIGDIRFYAAHQLVTPDHVALGTLCVFDDEPRRLTPRQMGGLSALADRIVDVLELSRRTRMLDDSLRQLTDAHAELARSHASLSAFAGQVSHDLMNPLSAVSMALDLLEENVVLQTEDDALFTLGRARGGVSRMQAMIAGLLDYAQVGSSPRFGAVALEPLVADVRADLAVLLADADLDVGALPVVYGDAVQLRAVLQNLLANAAKFTRPHRRPRIGISAEPTATGWRVEVVDNGPGVPEADQEAMFGLLARGDVEQDGSGIGLATCRRIVTAHGGAIGLATAPSGGCLAWFTLADPATTVPATNGAGGAVPA